MKTKKLLLTAILAGLTLTGFAQTWDCGSPNAADVTATLGSDGTLTISGTGAMADYGWPLNPPWNNVLDQIKEVVIQNNVTSIGGWAFDNCSNLNSVTISSTVKSIGSLAFANCSNLISIDIPNSITSIGLGAFEFCTNLASVTLGSGLTDIGDNAFMDCFGLISITIPNSVTNIGICAFLECSNLVSVIIGSGITNIRQEAFEGCRSLASITVLNPDPSTITMGNNVFGGISSLENYDLDMSSCVLKVPAASVSLYLKAPVWSSFINIVADDGSVVVDVPKLATLTVSAGTLSPTFNPSVFAYTMTVPSSVSTITLTATPVSENATVSGDGQKALQTGDNTFNIVVTTKDGQNTYTVTITRLTMDYLLNRLNDATTASASYDYSYLYGTTIYFTTVNVINGFNIQYQLMTGNYSGSLPLNFNVSLNGSVQTYSLPVTVAANSIYNFTLHVNLTVIQPFSTTINIDAYGKPSGVTVNYTYHSCSVVALDDVNTLNTYSVDMPWTPADASITNFTFIGNGNFTSIGEIPTPTMLNVYPNPAIDQLTVSGLQSGETISVYNVSGQQLLVRKATSETEQFAVGHLPAGIYLVKISSGQTFKLIKK